MDYKPLIDTSRKAYERYCRQRLEVNCRPVSYIKWLEWKHSE